MQVYIITNKVNGKCYVGKTRCSLRRRWKGHVHNPKTPTRADIQKFGKAAFDMLPVADTPSSNMEKLWIIALRSDDPRYGYNVAFGVNGHSGRRHSEETRRRCGEASNAYQRLRSGSL